MRRGACNEGVDSQPHPAREFASKLFVRKICVREYNKKDCEKIIKK